MIIDIMQSRQNVLTKEQIDSVIIEYLRAPWRWTALLRGEKVTWMDEKVTTFTPEPGSALRRDAKVDSISLIVGPEGAKQKYYS